MCQARTCARVTLRSLCRNLTNRRVLATPQSLDALAATLQRCHSVTTWESTAEAATPPVASGTSPGSEPSGPSTTQPSTDGGTAATSATPASSQAGERSTDGGAGGGAQPASPDHWHSGSAPDDGPAAGAELSSAGSAVKQVMYVLVTLVTVESNVARHLVELEAFMPLLFSMLDTGVCADVLGRVCVRREAAATQRGLPDCP